MNILFVSALEGGKYSGTLHSVPRQVEAQSKVDNIYWINLTNIDSSPLRNKEMYHYVPINKFSFNNLPAPFDKPDIVIFEEYFKVECCLIARKCHRMKIPYVIVPRCQMTKQYFENKKIKKKIAGFLLFDFFAKKATAVHFLSEQERLDSQGFYRGKNFIVANGIDIPDAEITHLSREYKQGIFIGRYSVWQKGLDILIEAIATKKETLKQNNIRFVLYGPNERTGNAEAIQKIVDKCQVSDLVEVNGPVFDEEKKRVLMLADFFVHTSRFEGMPMSVLEALSYGVPCLVSQGSNMREIIENNNAGWGTDGTVEAVANSLEVISTENTCWDEKRKNAQDLAKRYSWGQVAKECHTHYKELLK